ncbi:hypothetical protein VNI00_009275 [Paramarasmius palmivorus]|uniref:Uncharacterized protein n=1 Tax=Paramarasmius palmivorus TaxID=297713 RepID=A0AAW0CR19_9AGAR
MPQVPPPFPQHLNVVVPPTPQALRNSIPDHTSWNFHKVFSEDLRYEHQMYGYVNAYLQAIFPQERWFLINPQYQMRPIVDNPDTAGDTSFGSLGGVHLARTQGSEGIGKEYPDFSVTKTFPRHLHQQHVQYLIALVEVKLFREEPNSETPEKAINQLTDYLEHASQFPNREDMLKGFVVSNEGYCCWQIMDIDDELEILPVRGEGEENRVLTDLFDSGSPFSRFLCDISIAHWNLADLP